MERLEVQEMKGWEQSGGWEAAAGPAGRVGEQHLAGDPPEQPQPRDRHVRTSATAPPVSAI